MLSQIGVNSIADNPSERDLMFGRYYLKLCFLAGRKGNGYPLNAFRGNGVFLLHCTTMHHFGSDRQHSCWCMHELSWLKCFDIAEKYFVDENELQLFRHKLHCFFGDGFILTVLPDVESRSLLSILRAVLSYKHQFAH